MESLPNQIAPQHHEPMDSEDIGSQINQFSFPMRDLDDLPVRLSSLLNQSNKLLLRMTTECRSPMYCRAAGGELGRLVLANYLSISDYLERKRNIIELGSGTGIVGIVASLVQPAASIAITDLQPMIHLMRRNVQLNGVASKVQALEYEWGSHAPTGMPYDLILAADCVYLESSFPLLVKALLDLTENGAPEILFCFKKRRKADKRFFVMLKKHFTWTDVEDDPFRPWYSRQAISLLRINRKEKPPATTASGGQV